MKSGKYSSEICYQQSDRPAGFFVKRRPFFSDRHSLYEFKTEASVTSAENSIFVSNHLPGSVYIKALFRRNFLTQEYALVRKVVEISVEDSGHFYDTYSDSWAALCDKAYKGLNPLVWAICDLYTEETQPKVFR